MKKVAVTPFERRRSKISGTATFAPYVPWDKTPGRSALAGSSATIASSASKSNVIASAVATVTTRVMVGTLVMCTSFRTPGLLAKMAATLDEVADGRLILGLGAGWHEPEYEAFGYPFDHRVDRFEEALQIIRRLLDGETVTFDGRSTKCAWLCSRPCLDGGSR